MSKFEINPQNRIKQIIAKRRFDEYLEEFELNHLREKILKLAQCSILLEPEIDPEDRASSKFGGIPDVAPDFVWPRKNDGKPLAFIGQIDLADLADTFASGMFAGNGMLSFFYDSVDQPWGLQPDEADGWKVFHFADRKPLNRAHIPDDLPEECRFTSCKLHLQEQVTFPNIYEREDFSVGFSEEEIESFGDFLDLWCCEIDETPGKSPWATFSRILGHPDLQQGDFRCTLESTSRGLDPQSAEAIELDRVSADDWKVLLQVFGGESAKGISFGFEGYIYFCIRQQDLMEGKLDRVWLQLQTS